jgi:hypothetical protein
MGVGRVPGFRQLSKKETRELSKLSWVLDEALSTKTSEARVLPDGRVLVCFRGMGDDQRGVVYPSRESLAEVQRSGATGVTLRGVPGARRLTKKETQALSKLPWVKDEVLSSGAFDARVLPDGQVLLCLQDHGDDARGILYPSRESLAELQRLGRAEAAKPRVAPTKVLLPPIDDFLRDVEAHAHDLAKRLHLSAEVLDETEESLNMVDDRLWKLKKRSAPQIVTPVVAYLGQVLVRATGGRWARAPTTHKHRVPVYPPGEMEAVQAAYAAAYPTIKADADKAGEEVRARGGSPVEVFLASNAVVRAAWQRAQSMAPKPIAYREVDVPIPGHENEPIVIARDGTPIQPFFIFQREANFPSKRSLRNSVGVMLLGHRIEPPAGT